MGMITPFLFWNYCELMIRNIDRMRLGGQDEVSNTLIITVAVSGVLGLLLGALIVGSGRKREHPNYHEPQRGFTPGPPPPPRPQPQEYDL